MLQNVTITPSRRSLEFGIYRDGDNNLDDKISGRDAIASAGRSAAGDERSITVEDTTSSQRLTGLGFRLITHRPLYTIADGSILGTCDRGAARTI